MSKLTTTLALLGGAWIGGQALAATPAAAPAFAKKPAFVRDGAGGRIEFTVDRETDVAVTVEDSSGRVLRHTLAAGVLGTNAPPPLKPGLSQSIPWDGKADWSRPIDPPPSTLHPPPFHIRVALGLGAKYDKVVLSDPAFIDEVQGMAAGPDGTLYLVTRNGASVPNFAGQRLVALGRDGTYERTLIPPPASATKEQIEALGGIPVAVGGRTVPMVTLLTERRNTAFWSSDGVAMTADGKLLVLHPDARIGMVDTADPKSPPPFLGPKLLPDVPAASFVTLDHRKYLAVSADGTHAYVSGIAAKRSWSTEKVPPYPAVYRVTLPERSPATPFFGDPARAGGDEKSLGSHGHGMAADGKGHLLICDPVNKRVVVVSEADGKFAGSFPAENAEFVAVDPATGAVYLLKVGKGAAADLVKLNSWKDPREAATLRLAAPSEYLQWRFAVDAGARPPVLWASSGRQLLRIEDLGDRFTDAKPVGAASPGAGAAGDGGFVNLTVDHYREDPEIYVRSGSYWWARYDEASGQVESLKSMGFLSAAAGACLEVGPDGNLYTQAWPMLLHKWDRSGKPLKWEVPFAAPEGVKPYPGDKSNAIFMPVCMVYMTHTLGIRADGHLFAFERKPTAPERQRKALYEYDPSGKRAGGPIIWEASDAVVGPRFDPQGNIYVAEPVRPLDELIPPEFAAAAGPVTAKSHLPQDGAAGLAGWYGSIVKFSPKGGAIAYQKGHYALDPQARAYDGEPKFDPSLKTVDAACLAAGSSEFTYDAVKLTGAEWMHFGISHVFIGKCNCENTRFDVDPFGRVWYPDLGRYRVGVLDSNGNLITTFGSYGNAESRGPESPVIDPKTGKVRPRAPSDAKDLKSPFAEPDIAFAWLIGVGATDKYAYMGDSLNRRLLRAKLVYAAEETCPVGP